MAVVNKRDSDKDFFDFSKTAKRIKEWRIQARKFKVFEEKVKHLEMIILGLFLAVVFISFELFLRIHDLYRVAYWVDVPSHLFGGMAVASLALMTLDLTKFRLRKTYSFFTVFFVSIMWEILETIDDYITPDQPLYLKDYFFWDGFFDIIFTLVGGITFLVIFNVYLEKKLGGKLLKV